MEDTDKAPDNAIYIDDLAKRLTRAAHTIRQWIRSGDLPKDLQPHREGGRKKLYWLPNQVQGLKDFAKEREARKGWQPS